MNAEETKAVVDRWFGALASGDGATAMACLADNVRWINSPAAEGKAGGIPGLSAIIPWLGDFASKAEVMATFGPWGERQEPIKYERLNTMIMDDQALVLVHEVARIKATGLVYDVEFVQRIQVAGGVIVMLRAYWDTCQAVAAFRGDMPARLLDAARRGDTAAAERVLPFGANPNQADPATAETALMMAAEAGHAEMVNMLLAQGAEPNLVCRKSGNSALHAASRAGSAEIIKLLLGAGAFINLQCPLTGETPLHEALKQGKQECAEILIEAGADTAIGAFDGTRPLELAERILGKSAPVTKLIRNRAET